MAEKPGEFPFTRGIHPRMYQTRLWTMRQYAGFGDAPATNRRFRYLLSAGQTGLSTAFDLPTQIGYDPDHLLSEGEVGRVGVSVATLEDIDELFDGIPLEQVSTSMTINSTAGILLALYVALARRRNVPADRLSGTVQNDILKEFASRGTQRFPLAPSLRLTVDVIEYGLRAIPKWNPISVSGYHMREAGCTAAQEIAFTLANGLTYLQAAAQRGLDPAQVAARFSFFFGVHNDLFEEAAKFRAARRLWALALREEFGIRDDDACRLRFHAQTCGSTLTAQQFEINTVRVAFQALAAVLGGTQSLHTNSRDEALALPTEASALLALRTQQIIAHESGATLEPDPLGGSAYLERLTDRLTEEGRDGIRSIRGMGGSLAAIQSGWIQREIQNSAYRYQREIEEGKRVIVGVNRFQGEEAPPKRFRLDGKLERRRVAAVKAYRRRRHAAGTRKSLDGVRRAARGQTNLLPGFVDAVEAGATVGELCSTLAEVFGEAV